jgi:hypothetical protein
MQMKLLGGIKEAGEYRLMFGCPCCDI